MRRRAFTVLLLPIIMFVFMVGWIFYWMGKKQDKGRVRAPLERKPVSEEHAEEEYVEIGLIENLMEKKAEA